MTLKLILLILSWLSYFLIHSALASLWLKARIATRWPNLMPAYRLAFNGLSLLLLIPPLGLLWHLSEEPLWRYEGIVNGIRFSLMGLAAFGFVWSLRYYDSQEFIGVRQLRSGSRAIGDQERLRISPLHRFVRHPWYSLGLVLIWTQQMDTARLVTALLITGYLWLGSRLEERKLLRYHGARYQHYREQVPGLIPRPDRYLTREAAAKLLEEEPS